MNMKDIVKDRGMVAKLFKILEQVIENDTLEIDVESNIKSDFSDFIYDSIGREFAIKNNFHLLRRDNFDTLTELIFLKFKDEEFFNSFDFDKHIKISKLGTLYMTYLNTQKTIKKEIDDLDYKKRELERELEDLDVDWINEIV